MRAGWRVVFEYVKKYRGAIATLISLTVVDSVMDASLPFVVGRLIDALNNVAQGTTPSFAVPLAILALWVGVQVLSNIIRWFVRRKNDHLRITARLRYIADGMAHILRLPVSFHKEHKTGAVAEILNQGAVSISGMVANYLVDYIPAFLSTFVGLALCFYVNVELALILSVGIFLFTISVWLVVPKTIAMNTALQRVRNEALGYGHDVVGNIYAVKHAAAEEYERRRLDAVVVRQSVEPWYALLKVFANRIFTRNLVTVATQALIFLASFTLLRDGVITIGELVMFNSYAAMVFHPFSRLANNWGDIQDAFVSAANAGQVMETPEEVYTPKKPRHIKEAVPGAPAVRFERVGFRYKPQDQQVLENISFSVAEGEKVALVGESGVGKSTLIDLLSRYYIQTSGTIELYGIDNANIPLKEIRGAIAVVPQEIALFNTSIQKNIAYGSFGATPAKIKKAAREAKADRFIEKFPRKYEQMVGNRGVKLSVGQKQRIAIARAMLRDPKILILDEPTSALDPQTEQEISESLERLMEGRTTFIIAHRLSTVRKADRILVIEKGKIVEEGNHAELTAKAHGHYRHLYELHIGLHE